MARPTQAESQLAAAVREWLDHADPAVGEQVWVAVSGGADSMALAGAVLVAAAARGVDVHALTVDHRLQPESGAVAMRTADWLREAGCVSATVLPVEVGTVGGVEAAAREARYAALGAAAGGWVLLGHTLDDQAESVLLGLGRGSGPRSIRGMAPYADPYGRPLLGLTRRQTRDYCSARRIPVWDDPHNDDPRFTRVRLRTEVIPLLDEVLGGGVVAALGRTAAQLRADDEVEAVADAVLAVAVAKNGDGAAIEARTLAGFPAGMRRRVIKRWLDRRYPSAVTAEHVNAVDRLVAGYRGQGPAYLPGGGKAVRSSGRIDVAAPDTTGRAAPRPRAGKD